MRRFIDLEHVDVVAQNGTVVEVGTFHHDYDGWGPFFGFDVGAESNPGDHMLFGFALDVFVDRTRTIPGNPYGGTAQGYVGLSVRLGYHDWRVTE